VSGGLDELQIDELVRGGAPIDAFGVGTRMGVSADHPYLDTAYKLVSYGKRPVMKLSRGKVTSAGRTQVFRKSRPFGDLVVLYDEAAPAGREPLLEQVMAGGRRIGRRPSLSESRARFEADLGLLPAAARDLRSPRAPSVRSSPAVLAMSAETKRGLL
jgi:nicotinate phosphoribosyltransferase